MLAHALAALVEAGCGRIAVVVGPGSGGEALAEAAKRIFSNVEIFVQAERRGTAHAVLAARAALERGADDVLVHYADTPLVRSETLRMLREGMGRRGALVALGFEAADPTGYGRLIERDVDEGDSVKKGEILARLDRDQLSAQREREGAGLNSSEAQLAEARARAYGAVAQIDWPGGYHRTDIALKALRRFASNPAHR